MRRIVATVLVGLSLFTSACTVIPTNQGDESAVQRRNIEGYLNSDASITPNGGLKFLLWRLSAFIQRLPAAPLAPTPQVPADIGVLRANVAPGVTMQPSITWIGHATVLAQFGGLTWLTDPMFSPSCSPFKFYRCPRVQPPGIALADLPHIDVVLISHDHYDHLDKPSVQALAAQPGGSPLFIVPLELRFWFYAAGITNVVDLAWWQTYSLGQIDVVLTPAQHTSGRSVSDIKQTLWGGFAVFAPDFHLFYSGDTGYSKDFSEMRRRFANRQRDGGFDIALLPIGAYQPRWFMKNIHIDPTEAVQVHRDLNAKRSLGVHWGTFELSGESLDEPPRDLALASAAAGLANDEFFVMAIGETRRLARRALPNVEASDTRSSPTAAMDTKESATNGNL